MSFESVLQKDIGPFGRWQFLTMSLMFITDLLIVHIMRFSNISPPFVCVGRELQQRNWSFSDFQNVSTTIADLADLPDIDLRCHRFSSGIGENLPHNASRLEAESWIRQQTFRNPDLLNRSALRTCEPGDWLYDRENAVYRLSLIESFDLVCDRKLWIPLPSVLYFIAAAIGSPLGGSLADHFGRKRVLCILQPLIVPLLLSLYFCQNYWIFVITYFFLGFLSPMTYYIGYVLCIELTDYSHRNDFVLLEGLGPRLTAEASAILFAFLLQDWRWHCVALGCCYSFSFLFPWWLVESPKWLIAKGRTAEALITIRRAIRINGATKKRLDRAMALTEDDIRLPLPPSSSEQRNCCGRLALSAASFCDFLTNPVSRQRWMPMLVIWVGVSMTYFAVIFYSVRLQGNPYVIALLSFAICLPGKIIRWVLYRFFDRKRPIIALLIMSASLSFTSFIMALFSVAHTSIIASIVHGIMEALNDMIQIYTPELFPTLHRSNAMGFLGASACFGKTMGMIVERLDAFVWKPLPVLLFVVSNVLAALCAVMLPNVKDAHLPDFYTKEGDLEIELDMEKRSLKEDEESNDA